MSITSRIGILGGAFSPPTKGHISLAQKVLSENLVDHIWISPCYSHAYSKEMISPEQRIHMCGIAEKKDSIITVSSFEIYNKIEGGTLAFIKKLRELDPFNPNLDLAFKIKLYMIIGLDNANTIDKWINYKELIETVPFIVVSRKGITRDINVDWYMKEPHKFLDAVDIPETSSTEVRNIISNSGYNKLGKLMELLDKDVLDYIIENNLYKK